MENITSQKIFIDLPSVKNFLTMMQKKKYSMLLKSSVYVHQTLMPVLTCLPVSV